MERNENENLNAVTEDPAGTSQSAVAVLEEASVGTAGSTGVSNGDLNTLVRDVQDVTQMIREATGEQDTADDPGVVLNSQLGEYAENLVAHYDRGGSITDEYRTLRTNLLARCQDDRFCFMVTSPGSGEGKTVTCLNLAFVMTERLDHRTILVDLNLRNGRMAELLAAPASPGVADYLSGRASLEQIIRATAYPNLFFIPAGQVSPEQAGELLGRTELHRMVEQIRSEYDYAIIDTPSADRFADATITGLATGDALLVVRANKTREESVQRTIDRLTNANINLVGMVMTYHHRHLFN